MGTRDRIPPVVPTKAEPAPIPPPRGPRALRSLRVRITVAATVAFTVLFALTSLVAIARVNASLEDGLRSDSARLLSQVTPQLEQGADPREVILGLGDGVPVEALDANGNVIVAPLPERVVVDAPSGQPVGAGTKNGPGGETARGTGEGTGEGTAGGTTNGPGRGAAGATPNGPGGASGPATAAGSAANAATGDFVFVQRQAQTPNGSLTLIARPSLDNVRQTISTLRWVLLLLLPLVAIAVATIVWVVVDRALRPVERLRAEVDQISHSTLTQRLAEPGSASEIDRLARTMNEMLDRLETATVQQRRFVSDAGHELKTPLTTIRSTVEVAKSIPDPDWPAVADKVLASEQRLEALVDDLLTLARFDEGAATTDREPVDLEELVMAWAESTAASRPTSEIAFDLSGVVAGRVLGDRRELSRLVGNLLDNAARHATTRVIVSLAREEGTIVLTVDDDGPGIPEGQRDVVFDRFVRVEESRRRGTATGERDTGTGLGLAIARACALRHDGTIVIEDSALGGARFLVTLPAA